MVADATFWNNLAERYSKKPVDNPAAFERKIAATKARMTPQDVVLDIGCGTGSLALRLAPYGAQLHGLDISSEMIRIARDKTKAQGAQNVTFHVNAFDETFDVFEPESLDGICAYSFLHLVKDPQAALAKIFGLLKPGGFFVSSTACLREDSIFISMMIKVMQWVGKAPHVTMLSLDETTEAIKAAGFVHFEAPDVGAAHHTLFAIAQKPRQAR